MAQQADVAIAIVRYVEPVRETAKSRRGAIQFGLFLVQAVAVLQVELEQWSTTELEPFCRVQDIVHTCCHYDVDKSSAITTALINSHDYNDPTR